MPNQSGWKIYFWLSIPIVAVHAANAVQHLAHHGLYTEFWLFLLQCIRYASVGLYAWKKKVFTVTFWKAAFIFQVAEVLFIEGVRFIYLLQGRAFACPSWPLHDGHPTPVWRFLVGEFFLFFSYFASFLYAFRSKKVWSSRAVEADEK